MAKSFLPVGRNAFEQRYLNGHCDALACALSSYYRTPIHVLYPVHILPTGSRRDSPDFLHAFTLVDGQPVDARGARALSAVYADYQAFLEVLKKPSDARMMFDERVFTDAADFLGRAGCSPLHIVQALDDVVAEFRLDTIRAAFAKAELVELQRWYEVDDSPGIML